MGRALGLAFAVVLTVMAPQTPALADAPQTSIRPAARAMVGSVAPSVAPSLAASLAPSLAASVAASAATDPSLAPPQAAQPAQTAGTALRPKPRPATVQTASPAVQTVAPPTPVAQTSGPALRPKPRPQGLANLTLAAAPMPEQEPQAEPQQSRKKREKPSQKGSVCGDPDIKGEALAPIKGKVKGCGLDQPVRVTSISGIRLNQAATFSCDTAQAMKSWIENGLRPAMGRREVVEIRVAASYVCRTRNNKKGAKISEHGRGRAVDVAGFVFSDGTEWSIQRNYNKQVRRAHKAACGIFGTTLGPGSDGYHEDHLHFDIAQHSNGAYCR